MFPISRDPPEGGTAKRASGAQKQILEFPISRDPPEGGTGWEKLYAPSESSFQFLGIPPKGELYPY